MQSVILQTLGVSNLINLILWVHLALNPTQVLTLQPPKEATVLQVLQASHKVDKGFVCISPNDIRCIDDVCNDKNHFWTIEVNGNYKDFNSMSVIKPSDQLKLKYSLSKER